MKVTPPHTRLAPWRRISSLNPSDPTAPPGSTPPPDCCDDDEASVPDRAAEETSDAVTLSDPGDPALVQVKTNSEQVAAILTVTLDAPPTVGNLLVLYHSARGGVIPDLTSGWTAHPDGTVTADVDHGRMSWRISDGTETSITVTLPVGSRQIATVAEFAGSFTVDDTAEEPEATDDDIHSGSVTPTSGGHVLIVGGITSHTGGGLVTATPDSGWTELVDLNVDSNALGGIAPHHWMVYQIDSSAAGSYDPSGVVTAGVVPFSGQTIAFLSTNLPAWNLPAPNTVDGDDATYHTITGTDLLRVDLGAAYRIVRTRIRIATTTAGARTFTIKGANALDFSDEVTLTTIAFTATGGLAVQDVTATWTNTVSYRYYELTIGTSDTYRVHSWELYEPTLGTSHAHDHGNQTGLTDDDHPQYLRSSDGGGDVLSTIGATGSTETIDLANGNVHQLTLDANCTLTFTGADSGRARSFRLYLWQDGTGGWDVTWPGSVEWAGGEPTLVDTAETLSVFMFETLDGGTVWHGYAIGGGGTSSNLRWEPVTHNPGSGPELVWDGDDLVMEFKEYA